MSASPASGQRQASFAPPRAGPLLVAAAAIAVFCGSTRYYFGQDDFLGLARARHLAPALRPPWRWLSGQVYFDLMRPFGTVSAAPYHVTSLIAHGLAVALLAHLLARRFSPAVAIAAALLFGAHPAIYTALYSVSGIGEILAGLFVLVTIALASRTDRARWLAPVAFALALLCKESIVLLPLALLPRAGWLAAPPAPRRSAAPPAPGRGAAPARPVDRRVLAALAIVAAAYAAAFFFSDVFGVRTRLASSAPYALSLGPHVLGNFATYVMWTVDFLVLTMRSFSDALDAGALPFATVVILLWLGGLAAPALRSRGWGAGGLAFLVFLVPVLGLRNHTYHYYLYAPLLGAAWCFAALLDAVMVREPAPARRAPRRRFAPGLAVGLALAALLTLNGMLLVRKIETYPFTDPRLRSDSTVDRARIARRVYDGLRAAPLPDGAPVWFWTPASRSAPRAASGASDAAPVESYWERNVRAALMDGLAVRVWYPRAGDVTFVHQYASAPSGTLVAVYDVDGTTRVMDGPALDSLLSHRAGAQR